MFFFEKRFYSTDENPTLIYRIFVATGIEITSLYIYLSMILFMSLTSLASISIHTIIEDVQSRIPKLHKEIGPILDRALLQIWRDIEFQCLYLEAH